MLHNLLTSLQILYSGFHICMERMEHFLPCDISTNVVPVILPDNLTANFWNMLHLG
ncbi:uncharacterized protein METZ01_LOCUS455967 [marine metagenome]|uniref:Uncharacterized protein n=1 Tax=marine metagenome TaxID=408172 RepID=A0A383A672_9ZZZZ